MLPKIQPCYHVTTIASTGKEVKFRPFTIGEQKDIMLVKSGGGTDLDVYFAAIDMIKKCVQGVDVAKLSIADFEQLFYDVRSIADGSILKVVLECPKCQLKNDVEFNVKSDFEIKNKDNFKLSISVAEMNGLSFEIRQPTIKISSLIEKTTFKDDNDKMFSTLAYCLAKVINGAEVSTDFTHAEAVEFLDQLPSSYFEKIGDFFSKTPEVVINKEITCSGSTEKDGVKNDCGEVLVHKGDLAKGFLS